MNILILGSGMYVTGRNGTGTGTILSSLAQTSKSMQIDEVIVVSKSKSSEAHVAEAMQRINKKLNSDLKVSFVLLDNDFNKQLQQLGSKTKIDAGIVIASASNLSNGKIASFLAMTDNKKNNK